MTTCDALSGSGCRLAENCTRDCARRFQDDGEHVSGCRLQDLPGLSKVSTTHSFETLTRRTDQPNTSIAETQSTFRPLREALRSYGSFVIVGGTITSLGVIGFLVFLWTGEGPDEGQSAFSTWRYIILERWITQATTLTSLVLRISNAAQASVCTGLVAAMVLEVYATALRQITGEIGADL